MTCALSFPQIARKLAPDSEKTYLIIGPMWNQSEVQQSCVPQILDHVHLWRRICEREKAPQTLMGIACVLRPPKESLLARQIHLPGAAAQLAGIELQPWFGVIQPAEFVRSGIAEVSRRLGRIAELLHDRDAGIMPKAEIDAVEFIARGSLG